MPNSRNIPTWCGVTAVGWPTAKLVGSSGSNQLGHVSPTCGIVVREINIFFCASNAASPPSGSRWKWTMHCTLMLLTTIPVGCTAVIVARALRPECISCTASSPDMREMPAVAVLRRLTTTTAVTTAATTRQAARISDVDPIGEDAIASDSATSDLLDPTRHAGRVLELPSPCLVVLVGPAGSGKSTWAATHLQGHVVSADALRALVGEGEHDLRASADAFAMLDRAVEVRLRRGLTTVIDSLGSDAARRARWRDLAAAAGVPCVAVVFDVAPAQVRRQNRARPQRVPDAALRHQFAEWPRVRAEVEAEPFAAIHRAAPEQGAGTVALVPPALAASRPSTPVVSSAAVTAGQSAPRRALRFGLQLPRFTWAGGPAELGERLRAIAVHAEGAGFDSLWVMDHFRQIPQVGPAWEDMPESWTTLAFLAACTARVRLGTLVSGITYRNVAHLGKIVATLDVLSGGRAECGIGLGWFEEEHRAYGWPFPSRAERYALLADALELLPRLWGPGGKPFDGRVLKVPDTSCYPRPLQAHVPILVGGSGERRTLRLVAEHADACNLFGEPDVVAHKVRVLRDHCAAVGRDPDEVSVSHLGTVLVGDDAAHVAAMVDATRPPRMSAERHARAVHAGTIDQHVARVARYVEAGVDNVIVSLVDVADPAALARYGAVIAACRALATT
jgi:F420-dependent oxidoreductase-like protein